MLNMIKMDLYRMLKSPSTWIILIAVFIMMFLSIFMTAADLAYYESNDAALNILRETETDSQWGIYIGKVRSDWVGTSVPFKELVSRNLQSCLLLMFLVVFVVSFANSEAKSGFTKNIAGQLSNRGNLVYSKTIIIATYCVLLIISAITSLTLGGIFFLDVNFSGSIDLLPYLGLQFLLHFSYGTVVLCLFTVVKSAIAALLSGILIAAGIFQIFDALLYSAVPTLNKSGGFSIMNYMTSGNISMLTLGSNSQMWIRSVIVAVIYLIGLTSVSKTTTQRRDI